MDDTAAASPPHYDDIGALHDAELDAQAALVGGRGDDDLETRQRRATVGTHRRPITLHAECLRWHYDDDGAAVVTSTRCNRCYIHDALAQIAADPDATADELDMLRDTERLLSGHLQRRYMPDSAARRAAAGRIILLQRVIDRLAL